MILFATNRFEVYNNIIHHFLEVEVFNGDTDIGDMIELLFPKYLYREQYFKCKRVLEDLFHWTEDNFYHTMSAFHELALYEFLDYMADLKNDMKEFDQLYFDRKRRDLIEAASLLDCEEMGEFSLAECREAYYDIFRYPDCLFEETDFLLVEALYNRRRLGSTILEDELGINIDFYYEILPLNIREKFKASHITLTGEVSAMLDYIGRRTEYGSLYKLFWENDIPVREERIQIILENMMDAYFHNQDVEITREASTGNGKVDFKLYQNKQEDEKILIEVKRVGSSNLKKGYEKQLTEYMLPTEYKNAFYLIACFTDEEFERAARLIREHTYTDTIQLYINISVLDLRKRRTASVS